MVAASFDTQPGPSSLKPSSSSAATKPSPFVSFRDIYDHLELARHQRDAHELETLLSQRQSKLKSCGSPFPPPSQASKTKVQSDSVKLEDGQTVSIDAQQRELCEKISERHQIDELESLLLLRTFLESEDRSLDLLVKPSNADSLRSSMPPGRSSATPAPTASVRGKATKATSPDLMADFLDAFNVFYFDERLYILRCVCALFRIAEDPAHELYNLSLNVLAFFADEEFGSRCLSRFEQITSESLPDSIREQPRYSTFWAKQSLKEQIGLLEVIFLLFYGRIQASPSFIATLLESFQTTDLGRQQANVGFLDREAAVMVTSISHLLVLIGVESLGLEDIMDGLDLSKPGQGRLVDQPDKLGRALDILEQTSQDPSRSPILLAWAMLLNRTEEAISNVQEQLEVENIADMPAHLADLLSTVRTQDGGPPIWRRLAQAAFAPEMGLFDTMLAILSSPLLTSSNGSTALAVSAPSALAYRAVFKGLLLSITELVKPEFLPNFDALIGLWEATFGSGVAIELAPAAVEGVAALCVQFWEIDSHYDSRCAVIDMARRRWPVSFRPLIRLTKALTGNSRVDALESWPTTLHPGGNSPAIEQACGSVFRFLGRLPTFAQVLPQGAGRIGAPFETLEGGDYTSVSYRVTRPTRVAGTHVELPAGTTGSTISELGSTPIIVLWSTPKPVSAWKVMRDVLASFPPYLAMSTAPVSSTTDQDEQVFEEGQSLADFAKLAPANGEDPWEDVAAEMLELFSSVLASSSKMASSLLSHLDGDDSALADDSMDEDDHTEAPQTDLGSSKDLASIAIHLLQHALIASPINTRLIDAAYKLLSILLPYLPNEIWQTIRSSNVLFGSAGSLPYLSARAQSAGQVQQGISPSMLLSQEVSRASYSGLISLLDFIAALAYELRRSQFVSPAEFLRVKASVLTRAVAWVFESVWPEYQSWRYSQLREKLEIGRRCALLFELILSETSWKSANAPALNPEETSGPAAGLVEAMEKALVTHANSLYMVPLVNALGSGQQLIDQLHRAGRQVEAALAEDFVLVSLRLAKLIVYRRRDLSNSASARGSASDSRNPTAPRVELGLLEHLFFDHAAVATRAVSGGVRKSARVELASAIMGYVLLPISASLSSEAAALITAVCRSTAEAASRGHQVHGLVSHLGTLTELESTMAGLVDLVGNTHQDAALRSEVWTMLGAIVDTQPAIATLLLTGRHLAKTTEYRLTEAQGSDGKGQGINLPTVSSSYGQALQRTALEVASDSVHIWKELLESNPALLESILRFLDVAWIHAPEHVAAFQPIRAQKSFFDALGSLATHKLGPPPQLPESFIERGLGRKTDVHDEAALYCHRRMSQARAVRLLEQDVQLGSAGGIKGAKPAEAPGSTSLTTLLAILSEGKKLSSALETPFGMFCEPALHFQAERKVSEAFPTVNLKSLRCPARLDDFDPRKQYGDDYIFDSTALRRKLEGFFEALDEEDTGDLSAIEEGVMMVATISVDWSLIDVQTTSLRAWTQLIRSTMGRVIAEATKGGKTQALEDACLTTWMATAGLAADERREGDVMQGIHAVRVELLSSLMELAWGRRDSGQKAKVEDLVKASELASRLVGHALFSVQDSIRGLCSPPFHRASFDMVLFCARQTRHLLQREKVSKESESKASQHHRALHKAMDSFAQHAISGLASCLSNCISCIQKSNLHSEHARQLEDDLDVLVSVFEVVIRTDVGLAAHLWFAQVIEARLFPLCIDLIGRAPVLRLDAAREGAPVNSANYPLFFMPLLSLLLAVSGQAGSGEQLALEGVVNALASNMLSESLESGEVTALLLSGDRNPMHECWTMMLRIIDNLIDNLAGGSDSGQWSGASARFIETDVEGFVRVYAKQIDRAFDLTPFRLLTGGTGRGGFGSMLGSRAAEPMSLGPSDMLSIAGLDELELIARLFYSMACAESDSKGSSIGLGLLGSSDRTVSRSMTQRFSVKAVQLLQPLVHLLQHPRELSSLMGLNSSDQEGGAGEERKRLEEEAGHKIRKTVSILSAGLWRHTRAMVVLCREPEAWPRTSSGCAIVRPMMRTGTTSCATLGTLVDLATYLVDHVRSSTSSREAKAETIETLEQVLGLAATQAAMWAYGRSKATQSDMDASLKEALGLEGNETLAKLEACAREELEADLSRELLATIRSASSAAAKVDGEDEVRLLGVISHFVERRLSPRAF